VTLNLTFLGKMTVEINGETVTGFATSKAQAILAYLIVTGRPHSRDALATMFWGEMSDVDAKTNLRQAIANLKKLFDHYLLIERESVAFDTRSDFYLDTLTFERLETDIVDTNARISNLQSLVALYKGEFLEGLYVKDAPEFEEWVVVQRERFKTATLDALRELARFLARRSEADRKEAINLLRRSLALDSWREETHRQLMLLLARDDQQSAALAQYNKCREILIRELGVEPSAETTSLYERIKSQRGGSRHHLPSMTTPFVGRSEMLSQLAEQLLDSKHRLITIVGPGGAGKTRLALEAAMLVKDEFLNGAHFISMLTVNTIELLPHAIASTLGISWSGSHPKSELFAYLSDKESLLVLDNFDHLVESSRLVSELLSDAPKTRVLVTSRERLNLIDETTHLLGGLSYPMNHTDEQTSFESVQMFIQFAKRADDSFQITPQNKSNIARICRLLQGLPLGIALAAPWTRIMTAEKIEDELTRGIALLQTTMRDVEPRHRNIRAVFDQSWRGLSDDEKRKLAILSVFKNGFTDVAARSVAGASIFDMTQLVDKSWIQRWNDTRFGFHELARQYVSEQLINRDEACRHHAEFFADWLHTIAPLRQTKRQKELKRQLTDDIDNILLMWQSAIRLRDTSLFDRALPCFFWLFELIGHQQEAIKLFDDAIGALIPHAEHDDTRGRLLLRKGVMARRIGMFEMAEQCLIEAEMLLQKASDAQNLAFATCQLAVFPVMRGDYSNALNHITESLRLYRSINDLKGVSDALIFWGITEERLGNFERGIAIYQEAADILAELDDELDLAVVLGNLGDAFHFRNLYEQAINYYQNAVEILRRYDNVRDLAVILNNLAESLCELARFDEAYLAVQESVELFRSIGSHDGLMQALNGMSKVCFGRKDFTRAISNYKDALTIATQMKADSEVLTIMVFGAQLLHNIGFEKESTKTMKSILKHPATPAFVNKQIYENLTVIDSNFDSWEAAQTESWTLPEIVKEMNNIFATFLSQSQPSKAIYMGG
jgi:DNA-binding SARP family transcriptional activator/predicted ATPase